MYAVIETGGKQYRVQPGDVLDVELLPVEDKASLVFDRVLLVGGGEGEARIGAPTVEGAQVKAVALRHVRGPKLTIFKKKKRKGYRRKTGYRQDLLRVRIDGIEG